MADEPLLDDLVPVAPEELLSRAALGAPGRLRIEVGLEGPRFAPALGQRTPREELATRRALGGVSYPAGRERIITEAGRWLAGQERVRVRLSRLPEGTYGSELEVLRTLNRAESEPPDPSPNQSSATVPPSAGEGNQEGSSASR